MNRSKLAQEVIEGLSKELSSSGTDLNYSTDFQLLTAVILSAQCTDERVNIVTKELFRELSSPKDFYKIEQSKLEKLIFSTGFYRTKGANIKKCAKIILEEHNGKVPNSLEILVKMPGIGRKTANVVLGELFSISEGVVVDTHVKRLAKRIGLTKESNPEKVELDLMKFVSRDRWIAISNLLIRHGRKYCSARKPKCSICPIEKICKYKGKVIK